MRQSDGRSDNTLKCIQRNFNNMSREDQYSRERKILVHLKAIMPYKRFFLPDFFLLVLLVRQKVFDPGCHVQHTTSKMLVKQTIKSNSVMPWNSIV